ncbi:caspase family protein [uncultured Fibrella sp.]|uniref:nSTAND1 domain-containing NTPase n=1 Tax=uncultured Fibrella sp. TaxID=1284596 RepID=UPI0035CB5523
MDRTFAIFPNRHAFLIGAQAYADKGIRPLKTPAHDIQLMADALAAYGFQTHLCQDPTRAEFTAFLGTIQTLDPDSEGQIVIYYAGHGVAITQQQTGGPPTYSGYLLPIDVERSRLADTAVSMQWVSDQIKMITSQQVLLILDCCYAGAVQQAASAFRGGLETEVGDISQDDFGHYTRYRANQILTSSAHNQQALDQYVTAESGPAKSGEATEAASPFATLLYRALSQRDADTNHDGIVTVNELQLYVQQRLEAAAALQQHEQTACLFSFSNHQGGEFMFLEPTFNPVTLSRRERVNPYKGLDAYQPEDSSFFYGRDAAIRELNRLLEATSFVVVVGASGTGKSSLVKAGVLGPYHRSGTSYTTIRPGKTPMAELERTWKAPPRLLLIDQMEELVTQSGDRSDEELLRFFAELAAFQATEAGRQMKVVATLRIEFVGQFNRQERFWTTEKQQYTIPVLDVDALQEIIIRPALQTGMFYYPEKETVARIIEDFRHYPNALPLLSLALNELYELAKDRPERTIYERDYPGIGQILEQKEQTILEPFRKNIDFFRDLLLRFVAFQGGEFVRRRVDVVELDFGIQKQPLCQQILKTLTDNRLLTGRDAEAGDGYYELTHEALIGSWRTYRQWIQQVGSVQLTLREELAEAAQRYVQLGSRRAYTWSSVALTNLMQADKPVDTGVARFWNFRTFSSQFGQLSWLSVVERLFLKRSFSVQLQNKLALAGLGLLIFMAIGVALFFQTQGAYTRLISNALYAESQNAYQRAQLDYKTADTLVRQSIVLQAGRRFLRFPPDSLLILADLAGQRAAVYRALCQQLDKADTLANKSVLLLARRNDPDLQGMGVAQVCRSFGQFIQTDRLYHTLDIALLHRRTRKLLDNGTISRMQSRAQAGYQFTKVMRENLLATCREVQESYQLNGQTDLATQYGRYITALETYEQNVLKPGAAIATARAGY